MAAPQSQAANGTMAGKAQPLDWVVVTLDEVPAALQQHVSPERPDSLDLRGWHNRSMRFWRHKPSMSSKLDSG